MSLTAVVLTLCSGSALAGVMHEDVHLQTYTDFGQNKGRYVVGERVNALVDYIRTRENGIGISYTDDTDTFYISLEQGMISFVGTGDGGPYAAIAPNAMVTVAHNGSVNASYGQREVGSEHSIKYASIDIRYTGFRLTSSDDYMLQRQSKLQVDATWNPLAVLTTAEEKETLMGDYVYHSGGGTMGMWHDDGTSQGLAGAYEYIIAGITTTTDMTIPPEDKFVTRQEMYYWDPSRAGADLDTPMPNAIRGGDSGSPSYRYNEELGRYEYLGTYAVSSGTSNNWSLSCPLWTLDTLDSLSKKAEFGSEQTVYLNAVDSKGDYIEKDGYSTTLWSGSVTTASGSEITRFNGVKTGLNTWADLSDLKDTQNWYAYDSTHYNAENNADGKLLQSIPDLFYTENIEFESEAGTEKTIVLRDSVDLGIGYAGFSGGSFTIVSESGEQNVFNHAGYVVNAGAEVHIQFTNPASYMTEWRKMGEGDLYIDGEGDTNALLNLGGTGSTYLHQKGGHAAYNVLVNRGARVVLDSKNGVTQIERDFTFGAGGGTLDMNGNSMDWYTTAETDTDDTRFSINALTEEAMITNSSGHVTLTYKEQGDTIYQGSFRDTDTGSLLIDYQGGGTWTLNSIHTDLCRKDASGLLVSNGQVVLTGTHTVHGMGSENGYNSNRLEKAKDWHYADAAMNVTVKSGATFELGSHARLTGHVTLEQGATYVMREGVQHQYEYVEGGVFLEDTSIYSAFFGHKGNINMAAGSALQIEFSEGVTSDMSYAGHITGAGDVSVSLGSSALRLTLSGENTFTGRKVLNSGGLIGEYAHSLGDTTAQKWEVHESAWIASHAESGSELLARIDEESTGTLALSADTEEQLDLSSHRDLFVGAEAGKKVNYGAEGTSEQLAAVQDNAWKLGGGGGELVVNYKLSGENDLILGASGYSSGVVMLTNMENDFSGDIIFSGTGLVLKTVDGALGNSVLHLCYGNGFGLTSADSIIQNVGSTSDGMVTVDAIATENLDMSGHSSLAIAAEKDVAFSGSIALSAGQGYLFSSASGGKLTLLGELDSSRNLVVDAQGLTGGTVVLAGNDSWSGDISVRGHRDNNGNGEITLQLGQDVTSSGNLALLQGGILDMGGHNLTITGTISLSGGLLTNSGASGELIFDTSAQELTVSTNLTVGEIRKIGSNMLSLGGNNAACRFHVDEGTLRLVSDGAFTSGSIVLLGDGTTLDNRTHALKADISLQSGRASVISSDYHQIVIRGGVELGDGAQLTIGGSNISSITIGGALSLGAEADISLVANPGASYSIGGDITLSEGRNLSFANSATVTLGGENIGMSGSSVIMNGGHLNLNRKGDISIGSDLIINGNVRLNSRGSADAMGRNLERLIVNGGNLTLWEESWSSVWNINSLEGSGNISWESGTTHNTTSRLILKGDGDFSGTISLNRIYENGARTHGAYIELATDDVAANASIGLNGASANAVASLAINTGNAHIKGLSGNENSFVYAGAARSEAALTGEARPETTRATTLSVDTAADSVYTFSGTIGNTTDTRELGISLVKTGNGSQTFDGASAVLNNISALAGSLNISTTSLTVNGNVELACGAELTLGDSFSLNAGQNLSVLAGGENRGSAVLNSALVLNGGSVSIDARGLSASSPLLTLGGAVSTGSNFGDYCQFDFSNTSCISFGSDYLLSAGDWSLLDNLITAQSNDYTNATFTATASGLSVMFSLKDGYLLWKGDESILQQDNKVVINSGAGVSTVNLTEDAQLGAAYINNARAVFINGAALSVNSILKHDTGDLVLNADVRAENMLVSDAATISGNGSLTVQNLTLQADLTTRMAVQVDELQADGVKWVVDGTEKTFTQQLTLEQANATAGMKVEGQAVLELQVQGGNYDTPRTLDVEIGGTGSLALVGNGSFRKTQQEHINISHAELSNLILKGGSTDICGEVNISGRFSVGHETVTLTEGAQITTGVFRLGDTANYQPSTVSIEEGASLKITGNADSDDTSASFLLAHWKNSFSTLVLNGGSITSEDARMHMGWDSGGTFTASAGTADLKGILFSSERWCADTFILGTADSGSAVISIGSGGISGMQGNDTVQLGRGTLKATADFAINANGGDIDLVGTGTGTIFDTNGHTITVNTAISGSGNLTKQGEGTLMLATSTAGYTGHISVSGGALAVNAASSDIFTSGASISLDGGALDLTAFDFSDAANALSVNDSLSISSDAMLAFGTLCAGTTYYVFDFTNGAAEGWSALTADNFSSNGTAVSDMGRVIFNLGSDGSFSYTVADRLSLVWNGDAAGTWSMDTASTAWQADGMATGTYFANDDNVSFLDDACLELVGNIIVNNMDVADDVSLVTSGRLSVKGQLSVGSGISWDFSGDTTLHLSEASLKAARAIRIGEGATLVMTEQNANNAYSTALDNVSGEGTLVMNYGVADNGVAYDFRGLTGTVQVESGRVLISASKFSTGEDAVHPTFVLNSSASQLVFNTDSFTLGSDVVLNASTTIHSNNQCSGTITGTISGTGGLTKAGAGSLEFTRQHTYTGETNISGGRLILNTGGDYTLYNTVKNGTLEVAGGTTLYNYGQEITSGLVLAAGAGAVLNGTRTIDGHVTVNQGAVLTFSGTGADTLDYGDGSVVRNFEVNGGTVDFGSTRQTVAGRTITLSNGALLIGDGGSYSGSDYTAAMDFNIDVTINVTSGSNEIAATSRLRNGDSRTVTWNVSEGASLNVTGRIHSDSATATAGTIVKDGSGAATISSRAMLGKVTAKGGSMTIGYTGTDGNIIKNVEIHNGASFHIAQGASLSISSQNIGISGQDGTASMSTSADSETYSAGSSSIELTQAHITATGTGTTVLNNKLSNSSVENAGTGILQVTHEQNQLSGVIASRGDVEIYNAGSGMTLDELHIAAGLNVSLLVGGVDTCAVASAIVVGTAEFEDGSSLNGNLTLAAGSTLEMQGTAQLNGTLELVTGADALTLAGSMYDAICNMQRGDRIILFTGLESVELNIDGVCTSWEPGRRVLASEIFDNVPAPQNPKDQYYVTYTCAEVGGGELAFFLAPEPTTTTLSLLALTALAARRRRK